ncbi:STAS domain-containing protein [Actinospica durhamensis]|uniref:STAS domain-containing protein n=1 Tax=Actinospica durhamensis TaxID=1508375 RepID=A0A941EXH9_9ACTN|nr:STAS domain-containing protein [Actinospica durhamensis]MBR7835759.1 STAS domain-containing protein [Actinospica durhamensis]
MAGGFAIQHILIEGRPALVLTGELDLCVAEEFERALLAALAAREAGGDLALDMEKVDFFDSSGLHALLRGARVAAESDTCLCVLASPAVTRVFDLAGVNPRSVPAIRLRAR